MDPQEGLILIDTNVFVIDLPYKRDVHYPPNRDFLRTIGERGTGFTTLINLLELCGILSFNLNEKQLHDLWRYFEKRYNVTVLPAPDITSGFPTFPIQDLFEQLQQRIPLCDALMLTVAAKYLSFVSTLITWDRDHFLGKFPGDVMTPGEFLRP